MLRHILAALVAAVLAWPAFAQTPGELRDAEQAAQDAAIQSNTQATTTNAGDIDALEAGQALQDSRLGTVESGVTLNSAGVAGNAALISGNADGVADNAQAASDNASGIATNGQGVSSLSTTAAGLQVENDNQDALIQDLTIRIEALEQGPPPVDQPISALSDSDAAADQVDENLPAGTAVGATLLATDDDPGDTITYSLQDDAGGLFALDASNVVTITQPLDFETATSHTIIGQAVSSGDPATVRTLTVTIAVGDDPLDNPPAPTVVDLDPLPDTVDVNAAENTRVGITIGVANYTGSFSTLITDNAGECFRRNTTDQSVRVKTCTLQVQTYQIEVTVTLDDDSQIIGEFFIEVTDDTAGLTIEDDDPLANQVTEGAAQGTPINFRASLSDGGAATWALVDDAGGRAQIDAPSGIVSAGPVPTDFETATGHSFTVEGTLPDGTVLPTRVFMFNVLEDNPPVAGEFPPAPTNPDVVVNPGDDLMAAFSSLGAGETLLLKSGIHPMGEQGHNDLPIPDNATIYFEDGAWVEGWIDVSFSPSGSRWRAPLTPALGSSACNCTNLPKYGPVITRDREVLIRDGEVLVKVATQGELNQNNYREVSGQIEIEWDPAGRELKLTHSGYFTIDGSTGMKFWFESHNAGVRGFSPATHMGALSLNGVSGVGPYIWGGTFSHSHYAAYRGGCVYTRNVRHIENAGMGKSGNQSSCRWPDEARIQVEVRLPSGGTTTETCVVDTRDSHFEDNTIWPFNTSWEVADAKIGLGSQGTCIIDNTFVGSFGTHIWLDNQVSGPTILIGNVSHHTRYNGAWHSEFLDANDTSANNTGDHRYAFLAQDNIAVGPTEANRTSGAFVCNGATFLVRRQKDAAAIGNVIVVEGASNAWCFKQSDTSVVTDPFGSRDGVFRDNLVIFMDGSDGIGGFWADREAGVTADFNGDVDNNTYVRSSNDTANRWIIEPGGSNNSVDFVNFATWTNQTGHDANSTEIVVANVEAWLLANRPDIHALLDR